LERGGGGEEKEKEQCELFEIFICHSVHGGARQRPS